MEYKRISTIFSIASPRGTPLTHNSTVQLHRGRDPQPVRPPCQIVRFCYKVIQEVCPDHAHNADDDSCAQQRAYNYTLPSSHIQLPYCRNRDQYYEEIKGGVEDAPPRNQHSFVEAVVWGETDCPISLCRSMLFVSTRFTADDTK
jgi:hypothetical protein